MTSLPVPTSIRGKSGLGRRSIAVIITALGLVLAVLVFRVLHAETAPPKLALSAHAFGLTVSRTNQELTLSWNPNAPEVQSAVKGHLIIRDGTQLTVRTLSPTQLSMGSSQYNPTTSSVIFELKLLQPDQTTMVESLQVVDSTPAPLTAEVPSSEMQTPTPRTYATPSSSYTGSADRMRGTRSSGTVIVHGFVARDTPMDIRVSRESLESAEHRQHDKGGLLHHVKNWSKKPGALWPFHHSSDATK